MVYVLFICCNISEYFVAKEHFLFVISDGFLKSLASFEVWKKTLSAHSSYDPPPHPHTLPQETPQTLAPPQQIHFPIDDKQSQIHLNLL